jgi:hypothetical protein
MGATEDDRDATEETEEGGPLIRHVPPPTRADAPAVLASVQGSSPPSSPAGPRATR